MQFFSGTIGDGPDEDVFFSSEDEAVADFLKRIDEAEKEGFSVTEQDDYPPSDATEPDSEDGDGKDEEEEDEADSSDDPDEDEDTKFERAHARKIEKYQRKFGDKWRDEWDKEYE